MRGPSLETAYSAVSLLMAKPRTALELARIIECTPQTIGKHSRLMQTNGLISGEKTIGRSILYRWAK